MGIRIYNSIPSIPIRKRTFFIKVNIDGNNIQVGNVIRMIGMCYDTIGEGHNDVVFIHGVVIDTDTSDRFITVLYLSPNIKQSDKKLPIIEIEGNPFRVTPIMFYVFRDFYKYVDVVTTLDKNTVDLLLRLVTIEQPMDKLSYRLKRFYKKEIKKYLSVFYDLLFDSIIFEDDDENT